MNITASLLGIGLVLVIAKAGGCEPAPNFPVDVKYADATSTETPVKPDTNSNDLDLDPEIIKKSPVLQRWRRQIPNVLQDIRNEPSFHTKIRFGYSQFPSSGQTGGINFGVEDVFIGHTNLTVNTDYQTSFNSKRIAGGGDLHYYIRPLGSYVNFAPLVGYRHLKTDLYSRDGVNIGGKLLLVLSRGGAADLALTQSWVFPGNDQEVGLTTLSVGFAVTRNLRLSTDIQKQNSREKKDSRVGIVMEWMP